MSDEPRMIIPADRLPPGFADRIDDPPAHVPTPHPATTVVLVRDGEHAPEILLLKRHGSSGFVPGAYVFPGGRVDPADGDAALIELLDAPPAEPPPQYWLTGIREVFEETGVLLARDAAGGPCPDANRDSGMARLRDALMDEQATLLDVMHQLAARPDISRMVYAARWITPVAEPRRYDTRFFIAELPPGCAAAPDAREMVDAVWVNAADAVNGFNTGKLPMVFPTIKTIQRLIGYRTVDDMLATFRGRAVPPILPRLVRTPEGVGIVIDEKGESQS